jgi:hypothetical protein
MWRDICVANRHSLLAELDAYLSELAYLRALLLAGDGPALEAVFDEASRARNEWADKAFPSDAFGRVIQGFFMEFIDLPPMRKAAGTVRLPGSKSISNRVLLLAALAEGETLVEDLLDSDDTRVMRNAIVRPGRERHGGGRRAARGRLQGALSPVASGFVCRQFRAQHPYPGAGHRRVPLRLR